MKKDTRVRRPNEVKVKKVPGPKGVYWKTGPEGTAKMFEHCTFKKGHTGKHQWE